ncbi:hypothetical protein HMN09_01320700 [Mycena chlorophos]|uniref:Amino acid transporter transmembrane domain-containing protein n=1 Tax=Mycena chlorophos TaxID=658473 RepID=A0A8H6S0D9_MYCCL|nr:hypothetical protein HMN09_01320700 [Mycena chlorophos]
MNRVPKQTGSSPQPIRLPFRGFFAVNTPLQPAHDVPYVTPQTNEPSPFWPVDTPTNSHLIPNSSTLSTSTSTYTPIPTIYLREDGRCPKCYKQFSRVTESSWGQHLDKKTCKERASAIDDFLAAQSAPTPAPALVPPETPSPSVDYPSHFAHPLVPTTHGAHWTGFRCPGHEFVWDVGDFARTFPHQIGTSAGFCIDPSAPTRARSVDCSGFSRFPEEPCNFCVDVASRFKKIRDRAAKPPESVRRMDDLSWAQLRVKYDAKMDDLNALKLEHQNMSGLLSTAQKRLANLDALFLYLQTTQVPALHRILARSGTDKWSVPHTLSQCQLAAAGKYCPMNYFDWEIDIGMLIYELGGLGAVHAMSESKYSLPTRTTINQYRKAKSLEPCLFGVDFTPVYNNIDALFSDVPVVRRCLHSVMFDEIAKSAKVDFFPEFDAMGGLCIEHISELGEGGVHIGETLVQIEKAAGLVRKGKLHIGELTTVGAISALSRKGYGAKPVLIVTSCKQGTWKDCLNPIVVLLEAWKRSPFGEAMHGPIAFIASDGDPKRRIALFMLCMIEEVKPGNPLYELLRHLFGLNLFTGPSNITMDLDFKHNVKRICTTIRSPQGMAVKGICINRDLLLVWLERVPGSDWSEVTVHGLLNPTDAQDVPRAVKLCLAIIDIRKIDHSLLQPFINTTLTLSEQVVYLVKFSFMLCGIYLQHGTSFIPNQLRRCWTPKLEVFVCLLGDDLLEAVFGRVRMLGGHHPNCSLAEFLTRGRSAMNLDAIFRRNPHLERIPSRLNLFRMEHVDHLRPRQYTTELRAGTCFLLMCWHIGCALGLEELANAGAPFSVRENNQLIPISPGKLFSRPKTDLLRPFGGKYPAISGRVDRSLGESASSVDETDVDFASNEYRYVNLFSGRSTQELLEQEARRHIVPMHLCSAFARIDDASERRVHKTSALRILFDMYIDLQEAHDRCFRVRGFTHTGRVHEGDNTVVISDETHFKLGQLFVTLVSPNGVDIALAVATATAIKDGQGARAKSHSAVPRAEIHLRTSTYVVSGQVLSLVPVPPASERGGTWTWIWDQSFVSFSLLKKSTAIDSVARVGNIQISVSSRLIQPFMQHAQSIAAATASVPMRSIREKTWYFEHAALRDAWDTIWRRVGADNGLHNKFVRFTKVIDGQFPYAIPASPPVIFSLPAANSPAAFAFRDALDCSLCDKSVKKDKRQRHMGQHLLAHQLIPPASASDTTAPILPRYPCGFCAGNSLECGIRIDAGKAKCDCPFAYEFAVAWVKKASDANPCTNVPIKCFFCDTMHWKYNMVFHLDDKHGDWRKLLLPSSTFLKSIDVSRAEQAAMGIPAARIVDWLAPRAPSLVATPTPLSQNNSSPSPAALSPSKIRPRAEFDKENSAPVSSSPAKRDELISTYSHHCKYCIPYPPEGQQSPKRLAAHIDAPMVYTKFVVSGSFGDIGGALHGLWMRHLIIVSQMGFVSAYIIFVSQNIQALHIILAHVVIFLPVVLFRDLVFINIPGGLIYVFSLSSLNAADVKMFNAADFSLFVGVGVYSFEAIGMDIPITAAIREPHKLQKVLTGVMCIGLMLFGGAGALAYLTFGSEVQTVVNNLDADAESKIGNSVLCRSSERERVPLHDVYAPAELPQGMCRHAVQEGDLCYDGRVWPDGGDIYENADS